MNKTVNKGCLQKLKTQTPQYIPKARPHLTVKGKRTTGETCGLSKVERIKVFEFLAKEDKNIQNRYKTGNNGIICQIAQKTELCKPF